MEKKYYVVIGGNIILRKSSQPPTGVEYYELPEDAESVFDYDIVEQFETREVSRVQLDGDGNPVTEIVVDEDGGEFEYPVYERDADGNIIVDLVDFSIGFSAVLNEQKRQDRIDADALKAVEQQTRQAIADRRNLRRLRRQVCETIMFDIEDLIDSLGGTESDTDAFLSDARIQAGMALLQTNRPERFKVYIENLDLTGLPLTADNVAVLSSMIDDELRLRGLIE